jgi:HSP20 family molecular chaperone IbpA
MDTKNVPSQTPDQETREEASLLPPVDVVEDAHGITLYADLPGVAKDNLDLRIEGDTLTIEGKLALELPQDMEASHVEVSLPRYRRTFTLSKELDASKIDAKFEQGVLSLRVAKAEHAQTRRIEVQLA